MLIYVNEKEKKLMEAFKEAKDILFDLGIEYGDVSGVSINTRAQRRWGQCRYVIWDSVIWKNCQYSINISDKMLAPQVSHESLLNVMIHELLHTCEGCMNHGKIWKRYAEMVNDKYEWAHIQHYNSAASYNIQEEDGPKYILKCNHCGQTYKYYKLARCIRYPERFSCGSCHIKHTLERVK